MKTTILSIALALTLFSCSTPDCETQLIELEQKRSEAMGRCGGSWGCYEKIQSDYDHKKQEILNDCK